MTILQQVEVVVIFMPYFWSIATHTVCGYCTNMMLICIARAVSRPKVEMLCNKIARSRDLAISDCKAAGVDNPLQQVGEDGQQRKAKALRQRNPKP